MQRILTPEDIEQAARWAEGKVEASLTHEDAATEEATETMLAVAGLPRTLIRGVPDLMQKVIEGCAEEVDDVELEEELMVELRQNFAGVVMHFLLFGWRMGQLSMSPEEGA